MRIMKLPLATTPLVEGVIPTEFPTTDWVDIGNWELLPSSFFIAPEEPECP